jgi:hypothetical protein
MPGWEYRLSAETNPVRPALKGGVSMFELPILKLCLKKEPWFITTDEGDQNLILFMEDDDGKIRNFIIPMADVLDWDLEYESTQQENI